eukprot:TRINITY_DN17056_c0_g1_i2.p1 TRINITY_DN17056_c0_g1~~TRINITY_DN17056_c0_g1_i2.p1  ORF type:complete len:520 (-),score=140.81 TRINITY_DN17056_c0_g1_i2:217-1776(-)
MEPAEDEKSEEGSSVREQQLRMAAEVGQMLLTQNNTLKAAQAESSAEISRLTQQLAHKEGEVVRNAQQIDFLRKSVHELEKALQVSKEAVQEEHTKTKALRSDMASMNQQLDDDSEVDQLRSSLEEHLNREKVLSNKLQAVLQEAHDANTRCKATEHERDFLERRCISAEKRSDNLKIQVAQYKEQLRSVAEEDMKPPSLETIMASPGVSKVLSQLNREKRQLEETVNLLREELESLRLELRGAYEMSSISQSMSTTPLRPHGISLYDDMYSPNRKPQTPPVMSAFASMDNTPIGMSANSLGRTLGQHARGMSPALSAARLGMSPAVASFVGSTQALQEDSCESCASPVEDEQEDDVESADREYFLMTLTCLNCVAAEQDIFICPSNIGELLWQEIQEHAIEIHRWHSYLQLRIQRLGAQGVLDQEEGVLSLERDVSLSPGEPPPFMIGDMHRTFQDTAVEEDAAEDFVQAAAEMMHRQEEEEEAMQTPQRHRAITELMDKNQNTPAMPTPGASPFLCV